MADHLPRIDEPPIVWRLLSSAACLARALRRHRIGRRIRRVIRKNRYEGATLVALAELHLAVTKREKRMVLAHADVCTRPELGTALAHDNVAAGNLLAAEQLHAEPLTRRVAPVARR